VAHLKVSGEGGKTRCPRSRAAWWQPIWLKAVTAPIQVRRCSNRCAVGVRWVVLPRQSKLRNQATEVVADRIENLEGGINGEIAAVRLFVSRIGYILSTYSQYVFQC
jgi:hypothetical protein